MVTALCPTFDRPSCVRNALACWLDQDYNGPRELIVCDDSGQFRAGDYPEYRVISTTDRYPDLATKYNAMVEAADPGTQFFLVWEDDDVYLPHHVSTVVRALEGGSPFVTPGRIYHTHGCEFGDRKLDDDTGGRFHGAWGFTAEALEAVGGWPTRGDFESNFDLQLWGLLNEKFGYTEYFGPTYVWRFGHSYGHVNLSGMPGEEIAGFFSGLSDGDRADHRELFPEYDGETLQWLSK